MFQPNGRFETNKKICLSISGHHPETWQPSWSIRTALLALIAFMSSPGNGAIGSLDYTPEERKVLAKKSQSWSCPECGKIILLLSPSNSKPITEEETSIISQIALKAEENVSNKKYDNVKNEELDGEVVRSVNNTESNVVERVNINTMCDGVHETETIVPTQGDVRNYVNDVIMWGIVGIIVLLLIRRVFFL